MRAATRSIGQALTARALHRRGSTRALAALLGLAALGAFARLAPVTDVAQVLRTPAGLAYERAARTFGLSERAFVLIEAPTAGRRADLIATAEALRAELRDAPEIARVDWDLPLSTQRLADELVLPFGPLFFGPGELAELTERLMPDGQRARLEKQVRLLGLPGLGPADEWIAADPLDFHRPLVRRLASLRGGHRLAADARSFLSADERALLVTATTTLPATSASGARRTIDVLERALASVARHDAARDLELGLTGAHALARESERVIRRDLILSLSTSIALAFTLIAFTLRLRLRDVGWVALPTLWGTTVGIGAFVALQPTLAALSLGAAAILIGLGVDFTIHFVVAARDEEARGGGTDRAIERAGGQVFERLAFATATSSAAFGAFLWSDASFLRDMGALALCGLVGCFAGAYLVLPPLLAAILPRLGDRGAPALERATRAVAGASARHAGAVLALTALATGASVAVLLWSPPRLEDDLRNVHARDSAPLAVQERIAQAFGGSFEPLLVLVEDADEVAVVEACQRFEGTLDALRDEGRLAARLSPAALVPARDDQRAALAVLASFEPDRTVASFRTALADAGFRPETFERYAERLHAALRLREPLTPETLRRHGFADVVDELVRPAGTGPEPAPAAALIVLYPTRDPWSPDVRAPLVERLQRGLADAAISGTVTGLHQISAEAAAAIQRDFGGVVGLTLALVVGLMAVRFRRPSRTLLVLVPTVLGSVWTAACFSLFDARLNFMNLSVLPMVFAIGIDDGIHLLACFLDPERRSVERIFATTGVAVVLTSLTTMVTFGSLGLSANRGLASVGLLSALGVGACLVASIVVLPACFHVLRARSPH